MSTKKNLIVPKLKKQTLGKINPQKAEYLYISRDFCKSGFAQILKDGGEQFKEIQKFINNPREPQYILVHASKLEEGYLAISLLAGIYNEINQRGEWEDGMSDGNEKTEPFGATPTEPGIQWSESWQCLPIIPYNEADDYYNWHEDSFSAFGSSFMASQKTNDTFVPYWTENEDKPVCITMNDSGFFMWQRIIETLNNFSSNEQVYILILHEENNFDSINSFGGFGGFDTFESDSDKNLNQIILSLTAEELVIPKTRSVSFYYENIWKQMVKSSGCRLERKFPVHDFLLDIEKMNKEFSYEFLDKILKYVLRNREHGILRKNDFQFMDRFAGKRDSLEQQTESRSAIRCLKEDLIGMEQVKEQVMETVQVMKFNRLRKEMGLKKSSYHNVHMMLGAPGTAKTTVAKLMGKIMEEEKLLPGSQFACVNGAELKGMYVGHSAPKTKALFEENDIIVIDEAYSLTGDRSEPDSFSREAIAQLVIELEEHAEDKLVIFAGYGGTDVDEKNNKMKEFIDANPGIKSRINSTFYFPSYTAPEMAEIFQKACGNEWL
ncbi:MAG: AAA family ATPase [Enterocloster sp.]